MNRHPIKAQDTAKKNNLSLLGRIVLLPVFFYRYFISPFLGVNCRYSPSCSEYAVDAIKLHGAWKGGYLAARRMARCHPFGGSGYDPVPKRDNHGDCNGD